MLKTQQDRVEFVVDQKDLEEAIRIVQEKTHGNCIIGTKPQGEQVLVQVLAMSLTSGEGVELQQTLQEKAQVHTYSEGAAPAEMDL